MPATIAHVPTPLGRQNGTLMTVAQRLSTEHAEAGGRSVAVLSHNRNLHMDDAEVVYVDYTRYCPNEWFTRRQIAVDIGLGALGLPRPHMGRLFLPAVEAVAAACPDVVLVYEGTYAATSLRWWRSVRPTTRVFLYVHNKLSSTYRRLELSALLRQADGVVVCAQHFKDELRNRLGQLPVPVHVVRNGVDGVFFERCASRPAARRGMLDVLFAGQVAPHKGVHVLLEALARLADNSEVKIRACIVGSGTYAPDAPLTEYEVGLRRTVERARLAVTFVPFVDKATLRGYYRRASVVCVPSAAEAFGLVAVEAMACGAPVVASGLPGLREAGGDAAMYVAPGDPSELAACLSRLALDPEEQDRRSQLGQERAAELSWGATYHNLLSAVLP